MKFADFDIMVYQRHVREDRSLLKKIHVFRVKPGFDLLEEVNAYCGRHTISSAVVLGIIGSLTNASLAYIKDLPGRYETYDYQGPLEIVAAQGSIAQKEYSIIAHIHIQLSTPEGCFGGHLSSATVFSTAEVMLGELDFQITRALDSFTGLNELVE